MTSRIGSDQNFIATTSAGILDDQANSIVSSDTTFGSSPLGVAARTQALYGIANANFNLTPPDPTLPIIDNDNPLPYWTVTNGTEGDGSAISVFDDATSTWGVQLSLGTSITDAAISMTTRSFLLTDDNLALRQKALAVLSKSGTAGGTAAQWNLVLSAEYFSAAGDSLSSYAIGTVTDVGTWTSISGTTTAGGSAISSSAAYVDLTFTMTALGTVTGSAKATIKSLLLTTTSPSTGGGGNLVTETFTSSGTWNKPAGVENIIAVVGYGAGGGGASGSLRVTTARSEEYSGAGGGGARWAILKDIYVGDQSSISVGIGAGGAGGSARSSAYIGSNINLSPGNVGAQGGATTFGSFLTIPGGGGAGTNVSTGVGGTAGGPCTLTVFDSNQITAGTGARGTVGAGTAQAQAYGAAGLNFTPTSTGGLNATAGSYALVFSGTGSVVGTVTATPSGAGGSSFCGGGGAGGYLTVPTLGWVYTTGGSATAGGGGGGVGYGIQTSGTVTSGTVYGSDGANGQFGGGGGGGGYTNPTVSTTASRFTAIGGKGGNGSDGFIAVVYIG